MGKAQRAHQTTVVSLMMGTSQAPLPILPITLFFLFRGAFFLHGFEFFGLKKTTLVGWAKRSVPIKPPSYR